MQFTDWFSIINAEKRQVGKTTALVGAVQHLRSKDVPAVLVVMTEQERARVIKHFGLPDSWVVSVTAVRFDSYFNGRDYVLVWESQAVYTLLQQAASRIIKAVEAFNTIKAAIESLNL